MSPLEELIRNRISKNGPMTVAEYIEISLGHPEYGYYMKGDPFGVAGDFITAPEISQVFGELIGLWAAVAWQQIGEPQKVVLIECGPGRGTLMRDLLRAAKFVPGFADAIELHLIETSPAMRELQRTALLEHAPDWHDAIDTVPPGPTILIANEFLDALPVRQFVRTADGWAERCIDIRKDELVFAPGNFVGEDDGEAENWKPADGAAEGAIFETCPAAETFANALNERFSLAPGAALFIDYGHAKSALGDTLQAVRNHDFSDVLSSPGESDITAHVDFDAFGRQLRESGSRVMGPISQSSFLTNLGIGPRTDGLARKASAETAETIRSGTLRLTAPDQMGELFKVMVAAHAESPTLAGFERWAETEC